MNQIAQIQLLLSKLEKNEAVSLQELKMALGDEGIAEYWESWNAEIQKRRTLRTNQPLEVVEYSRRLKAYKMLYARAHTQKSMNSLSRKRAYEKAEEKLESAVEYLNEMVPCTPGLILWFKGSGPPYETMNPPTVIKHIEPKLSKSRIKEQLLGEALSKLTGLQDAEPIPTPNIETDRNAAKRDWSKSGILV